MQHRLAERSLNSSQIATPGSTVPSPRSWRSRRPSPSMASRTASPGPREPRRRRRARRSRRNGHCCAVVPVVSTIRGAGAEARIPRDLGDEGAAGSGPGAAARPGARAPRRRRWSSPRRAGCSSSPASPGGVDHLRGLRRGSSPRHSASPVPGNGSRSSQRFGPQRMQARVPVADVAAVVGGDHVLVPGDVGAAPRRRRRSSRASVELVDADDRLQLAAPDRVAAGERDAVAASPAPGRGPSGRCARSIVPGGRPRRVAADQVRARREVGRRRAEVEDLVAAVHRPLGALEAVGLRRRSPSRRRGRPRRRARR